MDKLVKPYEDKIRSAFAKSGIKSYCSNWADNQFKKIVSTIFEIGTSDIDPRPVYKDGTPAHTISINHVMCKFDLSKGKFPILTLRPMPFKTAIGELLWIYQDASNSLDLARDKYGITWWDEWDIGDRTIGACYGETVRRHNLVKPILDQLKYDPDGRRHIISLWQDEDFNEPHGLKPCCFMTNWNVRHEEDGDYLDMCLYQRSADFAVGVPSNWIQYATFLSIVAACLNYKVGVFTWFGANVQIYDRHIEQCIELFNRDPVPCDVYIDPKKLAGKDFYDVTMDDIKLVGYPRELIKQKNPQLQFPLGI